MKYQVLICEKCTVTLEARPTYCDRGRFMAQVWPTSPMVGIDYQDGFPRYYFDEERAKLEMEAFLRRRGWIGDKSVWLTVDTAVDDANEARETK